MIHIRDLFIQEIGNSISCDFSPGIYYLKGKNGSGKTLLLDYVGGLRSVRKPGSIDLDGNVIYMRQGFVFYNRLTVLEFVDFIQKLNGENVSTFENFIKEYHPELKFEDYKKKRLGLLSGGERRLIYTLTILSIKRDWYILDEPFTNMDKETKDVLVEVIEMMNKRQKASFIITSHEDMEIKSLQTIEFENIISTKPSQY